MTPGVHDNLTSEQYHASPGISKTGLARYAASPARFRYGAPIRTRSMAFGSLIHCAVLEPDQLANRYQASQLRAFDERHEAYQAELATCMGRELVKQADYDHAQRIRDAVHRHPVARAWITPQLVVERSYAWIDPATNVLCRARSDGVEEGQRVILDLKSCEDAGEHEFSRNAHNFRYHWQVPMYSDGMQQAAGWTPGAFVFLAVEKEAPFLTAAYELEQRAVNLGRTAVERTLSRYADSLRRDDWPGHPPNIRTLALPPYAYSTSGLDT